MPKQYYGCMIYTERINDAIRLAIATHEVTQKQKRKGKDIPYIVHPLGVGLILARAGAEEDVIIAGLLHDTIEDSHYSAKVTRALLEARFGERVAGLVDDVTEQDRTLSWDERKSAALAHLKHCSREALLVKSADLLSNATEVLEDYGQDGDGTFARFSVPKEKMLGHYRAVALELGRLWGDSPLGDDLAAIAAALAEALAPGLVQ